MVNHYYTPLGPDSVKDAALLILSGTTLKATFHSRYPLCVGVIQRGGLGS
jgi:hypothetical protein